MALACGFYRVVVSGPIYSDELNRRLAPTRLIFVVIRVIRAIRGYSF